MCVSTSFAIKAGLAEPIQNRNQTIRELNLCCHESAYTFPNLLRSVEIEMPTVAVNDHLEVFGDGFVEVELEDWRDIVEQNRLIPRPFARKQVKQNRIVSTWLQVLQVTRTELNFSRNDNTDELVSHHEQPQKKLFLHRHIHHFLRACDSLFTSFTTNSTVEESK